MAGFSAGNRVWRVTKSQSFTDVVTGRNTGTGSGTISGWLNPAILGSGAREWYTRIQVYFNPNHTWPAEYDFKMFFALPRDYPDPPSADYEAGLSFHQDVWCGPSYFPPSGQNFNDVPIVRYGSNFAIFPYQNEYCPPLTLGQDIGFAYLRRGGARTNPIPIRRPRVPGEPEEAEDARRDHPPTDRRMLWSHEILPFGCGA